jgi:aspartyl-tRNA(Asn)/glutamyl-tRNA(Gln) amidotransferase subunit A
MMAAAAIDPEGFPDLSLSAARDHLAAGRISARTAAEACLARLETRGRALNAVAALEPERAFAGAEAADRALAEGRQLGPLHGVPLAHKDMFYRAGRVSAWGSRLLAETPMRCTSEALRRLDGAGALDLGRLNMVEFALGTSGHNTITGAPRNPWNPDYITGGSSSGSGAVVAARLVFGALGSDTGASVRLPAACCGIVGLKTTLGRVSRYGIMPLAFSLDTVGPLARTVEDCARLFQVIDGADPKDRLSVERPPSDVLAALGRLPEGLRIGVPESYFEESLDSEIAAKLVESRRVFERLGARLVPVTPPAGLAEVNRLTRLIISVEGALFHAPRLRAHSDQIGPLTLARMRPGLEVPPADYLAALEARTGLAADWQAVVGERCDLLHTPILLDPVPKIEGPEFADEEAYLRFAARSGHCCRPANYLGLPAISLPAGFDANGLPCAFQLIGRHFEEELLLAAAAVYERETLCTAPAPPPATREGGA